MGKPKLIDTWIYSHKGIVEEAGDLEAEPENVPSRRLVRDQRIDVKLYIVKEFEEIDSPPHATKSVSFIAKCDNPKISVSGTDIEAIRRAVWAELDKAFKIKWSNWFLVDLTPQRPYEGFGTGMSFSYKNVEKGVAWDGAELLRDWRYRRSGGNYEIRPWPGAFTDNGGRIIACIPNTPENEAALEEFGRRIDELRKRLASFLEPEVIIKTLQNLNGVTLLPGTNGDAA